MSAAQQLSREARLRPSTPESRARETLHRELNRRCIEMARLQDGWDGRGSKAPTKEVLLRAGDLGLLIVGLAYPVPSSINLGASADGFAQFGLFGQRGREADLWVEDDSGEFSFEAVAGDNEYSGRMPIANFMRLAQWLSGDSAEP